MDAIVRQIMFSAKNLGISQDSEILNKALLTALIAEEDGYDPDTCVSLGRSVLVRATQPADSIAAA